MTDPTPRIDRYDNAPGLSLVLRGRWSAAQLGSSRGAWQTFAAQLQAAPLQADCSWDLRELDYLDHMGAQLLWNRWQQQWPAQVQCTQAQRSMLERVARFTGPLPAPRQATAWQQFEGLGRWVLDALAQLRALVVLVGQLLLDVLRLLRAPRSGPWRDVSGHLYQMGASALPITALVGFLIGVVLAYLTSLQLRQFGAESFIVNILGIALVRELGPMLAAILVAGRSGSAITAQIGVMRVTEELDAMRVMGIAHGFRLVMPRALALALAMPLISVWTTVAGLAGGMLAADLALGITPAFFMQALPGAVKLVNLTLASAKAVTFGVLIALVGCHFGLRVEPNTQSLGRGTTAAVVAAITGVILVDAIFAIVFRSVGI